MKKHLGAIFISILSLSALTSCGEPPASIEDKTANSLFGTLCNFQVKRWQAGQVLTFTAVPDQYYNVDGVTNNGVPCTLIASNPDGSRVYQTTLAAGNNQLAGKYKVKKNVDIVEKYKMEISKEVFDEVVNSEVTGDDTGLDFRRCGIEKMIAPLKYNDKGEKVTNKGSFINYVDGDTTHIESFNLGYTVKIRYLSINTPESTSEIEEWGLAASNYNKFLFSGDESYLNDFDPDDKANLMLRENGATTIILLSQAVAKHETVGSKDHPSEQRPITYDDLMLGEDLEVDGPFHSTTDGYQRNLAYVWYSTVNYTDTVKPQIEDFRCLNLEMVYQGFSLGCGSAEDTSEYSYKMFVTALNSAEANKRHIFSDESDLQYFYYNRYDPEDPSTRIWRAKSKTITEIFESCTQKNDVRIGYDPSTSPLADKKTLYKVGGYVSAKVAQSFYIQEKYEYDNDKVLTQEEKPFGIYVFTLTQMPISIGDYVEVIGALSTHGGTFQIQGISYSADPNYNRDTIIDVTKHHEVTPVRLTGRQFNQLKLPGVLVEITDNLYFYDFESEYNDEFESISEGGSEEINKYNEFYQFYNTNNTPIFYASYNSVDVNNASEMNLKHRSDTNSGIRYTDDLIRFTMIDGINISYRLESCRSWQFFAGGSYLYNDHGAKYANFNDDNPYKTETVERTFVAKAHKPAYAGHGLILVSRAYESTGGNRKMTGEICSNSSQYIKVCPVDWTPSV